MDVSTIIGSLAGVLTTLAALPQLVKSWRTKSTKDVAIGWVLLLAAGVTMWLIYGLMINDMPMILANVFTLILVIGILLLKLKYG